jgi:hypothetical protein
MSSAAQVAKCPPATTKGLPEALILRAISRNSPARTWKLIESPTMSQDAASPTMRSVSDASLNVSNVGV